MATTKKAQKTTRFQTTETLIESFELTINEKISIELGMVRGWIMDELELRNQESFDAWIDSLEDSPRKFYLD